MTEQRRSLLLDGRIWLPAFAAMVLITGFTLSATSDVKNAGTVELQKQLDAKTAELEQVKTNLGERIIGYYLLENLYCVTKGHGNNLEYADIDAVEEGEAIRAVFHCTTTDGKTHTYGEYFDPRKPGLSGTYEPQGPGANS